MLAESQHFRGDRVMNDVCWTVLSRAAILVTL